MLDRQQWRARSTLRIASRIKIQVLLEEARITSQCVYEGSEGRIAHITCHCGNGERERPQDGESGQVVAGGHCWSHNWCIAAGDADATDPGHTQNTAGLDGLPRAEHIPTAILHLQIPRGCGVPTVTLHLHIPQWRGVWGVMVSCTVWFEG